MQDEYDYIMVRGKPRYRKNKKMVKVNTLPRDVMERFGLLNPEAPEQEEETPDEPRKNPKACIFCGMHSRYTRFVNLQTIYVCDEHYQTKNIGKCAARLREMKELQNA